MQLLVRAGRPPHDTTSNEAAVAWRGSGHFGSNIGNMLYSDSVYRTLNVPGTTLECDAYQPEWHTFDAARAAVINERYDAYVLPMANAFRAGFADRPLARLTRLINRLTIPVIVVGIGAQMTMDSDGDPQLGDRARDNSIAFVRAVLDRSDSIGVRGERTREMLGKLGAPLDRIDVIGCPSLYNNGRDFTIDSPQAELGPDARIAVSLEGDVNGLGDGRTMAGLGEVYAANEREYTDLVAVYQTLPGVELILWGETAAGCPPGTPRSVHDRAYREGRLRSFTNPRTWREFLRDRDFAFGVRIHGNIAAITAGTPAVMLATDSRTQELADQHGIPSVELATAVASGRYLARDLHADADFSRFNQLMPQNWDRYHAFLERNGLPHIHQPGRANPEYDRTLAEAPLPPPITPLTASDPEGLATRVRWLRQGRPADRHRPFGSFQSEFPLDETNVRFAAELAKSVQVETASLRAETEKFRAQAEDAQRELQGSLSEARRTVEQLTAEVGQLRSALDRSNQRVESLESLGRQLRRPFERRAIDAVRRRVRRLRNRIGRATAAGNRT